MQDIDQIIFYRLERAIRSYRQFAQREIRKAGHSITVDQWLTMKNILENPGIKQHDLAEKVFKDNASITRIIELLVKAGYLDRTVNAADRRRSTLKVTKDGARIVSQVNRVVERNRQNALRNTTSTEIETTADFLKKVVANCQK